MVNLSMKQKTWFLSRLDFVNPQEVVSCVENGSQYMENKEVVVIVGPERDYYRF